MTKRDEAIEAMARAISPGAWGVFDLYGRDEGKLDDWLKSDRHMSVSRATAALDAALGVLSEPSPEMVEAGACTLAEMPREGFDLPAASRSVYIAALSELAH